MYLYESAVQLKNRFQRLRYVERTGNRQIMTTPHIGLEQCRQHPISLKILLKKLSHRKKSLH